MLFSSLSLPGLPQLRGLLLLCSLSVFAVGCGTSTAPHIANTTATPSLVPTAGTTQATAGICPSLNMIIAALQSGKGESVGFTLTSSQTAANGNISSYEAGPPQMLTGSGFNDGANNHPIQLQIKRTAEQVVIIIVDATAHQTTTYVVTGCTTDSSTEIMLTGTAPVTFSAGLDIAPA